MEDLLTKEIQKIAHQIMKTFHDTCEKHQIRYSMAYGTLLGAIRHQNFIPWDDDVDVFMLRSEYEKFKAVFKSDDCYELLDGNSDDKYPYLFPKIRKKGTVLIENNISYINYNIGVYIDIFILDEIPCGTRAVWKKLYFTIKYKLYRLCVLNLSQINPFLRPLAFLIRKIFSYHKLAKKCAETYKNERGELLRDASMLDKKMYLKKEDMELLQAMPFGGDCFLGSSNYNSVLTRFYGDYMQLPPENQRVSNHSFYKIQT